MKAVLILTFSLAIVQHVAAICNICNSNGVACISDNEFHRCESGQPKTETTYSCSGNKICTALPAVCVNQTEASAVRGCGDTSNCGICEGTASDGTYTCTSRRGYTMCFNGTLTDIRDTCPENQLCDIARGKQGLNPCVPNCRQPEIQFCDRSVAVDEPVVATTQSTTATTNVTLAGITTTETLLLETTTRTTTTTELPVNTAVIFCSQQRAAGYYANKNDSTCRNYIQCFRKGGIMQGTSRTCPNNLYYNPVRHVCDAERPQGCI